MGGNADIDLGEGDDTLLGFGEADVDGGAGTDTLQFEFSLVDFVVEGGEIDFAAVDFTFGGATLKTAGFEKFEFGADFGTQSLGSSSEADSQSSNGTVSANFTAAETPEVLSLSELEEAVAEIEAAQPVPA